MAGTQSPQIQSQQPSDHDGRARQIDSAAWALLIIWVGIVMLGGVPWAWFLAGVGVLMLGTQMTRQQAALKVEPFAVAIGLMFLAGGIWDLLALPLPLIPVILIALGAYLLRRAVWPDAGSS